MNESGKANGPKLLPHQLRFRQMAMGRGGAVKAEQGVLPSIAAKQWQYEEDKSRAAAVLALARLPVLPIDAVQWGIVESATGQEGPFATVGEGSEGDTDALLADVLLCSDGRGRLHLLAQGTARLGEVTIPNEQTKHRSLSTAISRDFSSLSVLASGPFSDGKEEMVLLTAKLHLRSSSQMLGSTPAHLHLLALSTTLHHLLSYLLDTLHLMRQVFRMTYIGQVADEWLKHAQEVGEKYRCDFQLECITAIAGGRLGDGIEVMIMSMINESALHMMEDTTYTSLRFLRRAAATVIGPACERILIILESLRAHGLLPAERDGAAFPLASETEALVQELLRASLVIEVEAEKDLLAAGEFYKWWKQERDKHENPRRDDGQFHPIIHDTLAAIEYVQRGFINPHLDALLGTRNACNVVEELRAKQVVATPAAQPTGLEEILRRTEQRLSDASVFNPALVVPLSARSTIRILRHVGEQRYPR
ncbi:hypothetical protein K437DRAFT_194008 [Tilletiaria anomala UBC 951]|uniref:Anaphase-promoting complex subunit 4 n=1 Tax=Tilletiaria anomala (strain ATCC 24038 / CBS 436.72 / UBC 951) TaxID=1037660 RepID=A0A066VMD2_TILAU|nr:uncharacterized protein K437DRAFT_194008 [Tilletiaria anomala UBC 951]KDN39909.1 hypothetical protein K437DRAFT_194008 [Tilletiaria anomala UBC 951]